MSDGRRILASPWLFAAALVIFVLFMALVLPGQSAKPAEGTPEGASFDTSLFYTPAQAFDRAAAHTPEARFAYIAARWSFDLAFPLVYGLFALAGWAFGLARLGPRLSARPCLALVAVLGPAFDFTENIAATVIMASVPARPLGWGRAADCGGDPGTRTPRPFQPLTASAPHLPARRPLDRSMRRATLTHWIVEHGEWSRT
jgi:hypothetical protein